MAAKKPYMVPVGGTVGYGSPEEYATGAASNGTWTPPGLMPPRTAAELIAGTPNTVTASPGTSWGAGLYVQCADGSRARWSGSAWVAL